MSLSNQRSDSSKPDTPSNALNHHTGISGYQYRDLPPLDVALMVDTDSEMDGRVDPVPCHDATAIVPSSSDQGEKSPVVRIHDYLEDPEFATHRTHEQLSYHLSDTDLSDERMMPTPQMMEAILKTHPPHDSSSLEDGTSPMPVQLSQILLVAYRWMNHFTLAMNQLACSKPEGAIQYIMVHTESLNEDAFHNESQRETPIHVLLSNQRRDMHTVVNDSECSDPTNCRLSQALRWVNGLTSMYRDVTCDTLYSDEDPYRLSAFPTSISPSCAPSPYSPFNVKTTVMTPRRCHTPKEHEPVDMVPVMMIPSIRTYEILMSEIRYLEALTQTSIHEPTEQYFLTPQRTEGNEIPSIGDAVLPSHPILDPRMPWNGSLWLPQDSEFPSTLPRQFQEMLLEIEHSLPDRDSAYPDSYPRRFCKLIRCCSFHHNESNFFIVGECVSKTVQGFVAMIETLQKDLLDKCNNLSVDLSIETEERLRTQNRMDQRLKEAQLTKSQRRSAMRARMKLQTQNFDLKRLCNCYEELLVELRQLVFDQSLSSADLIGRVHNMVTDVTPELHSESDKHEVIDMIDEWIMSGNSNDYEVPLAVLRTIGEFDSVVDNAADKIDKFRTAYALDATQDCFQDEYTSESNPFSRRESAATNSIVSHARVQQPVPTSLPWVDDVVPHFGTVYRSRMLPTATSLLDEEHQSPLGSHDGHVQEMPFQSTTYQLLNILRDEFQPGSQEDVSLRNQEPGPFDVSTDDTVVLLLIRKLRRYEFLLECAQNQPSRMECDHGSKTTQQLNMTAWLVARHLGERLIDLADIENQRKRKCVKGRITRCKERIKMTARYMFRRPQLDGGTSFDRGTEKEKLLYAFCSVISRLHPQGKQLQNTMELTNLVMTPLQFPRRAENGCGTASEVILELWDALGYFSGTRTVSTEFLELFCSSSHSSSTGTATIRPTTSMRSTGMNRSDAKAHSRYWPMPYGEQIESTSFQDVGPDPSTPIVVPRLGLPWVRVPRDDDLFVPKIPIVRRNTGIGKGTCY